MLPIYSLIPAQQEAGSTLLASVQSHFKPTALRRLEIIFHVGRPQCRNT